MSLVAVGSSVKGEYVVLDLVGVTEKCSVVMKSSDSFPFAHSTLDPSDFIFGSLKSSVRSSASLLYVK